MLMWPGGERELRNLYAYPFAKVIRNADPVSVMSCYSAYDGVPMTHSAYYMTDLLRGELGFKGYVYSDWGAVDRLKVFHQPWPLPKKRPVRPLSPVSIWMYGIGLIRHWRSR